MASRFPAVTDRAFVDIVMDVVAGPASCKLGLGI